MCWAAGRVIECGYQRRASIVGFADVAVNPSPTITTFTASRIILSDVALLSIGKASTNWFTAILATEPGWTFTLAVVLAAESELLAVELG